MNKVYVRFGDFTKNQTIQVFEALLEDRVVRIIMPTTSYHACQNLSKYIDLPAFIVDGTIINKNGELLMINVTVKIPLTYDKDIENYICDITIPKPREKQRNLKLPRWYH